MLTMPVCAFKNTIIRDRQCKIMDVSYIKPLGSEI